MKKFWITGVFMMLMSISQSQEIVRIVDDMEDKTVFADKTGMILVNEAGDKGFNIAGKFKFNHPEPVFTGINLTIVGLGCVEAVELIILFEDGTKMTKTSWNQFNCDGHAWYTLLPRDIQMLTDKRITKIRVTNGYKYDSITVPVSDPNHFITLIAKAARNEYETVSE
jgi:hypothetical protein